MRVLLRLVVVLSMVAVSMTMRAVMAPAAAEVTNTEGTCQECRWTGGAWSCTAASAGWGYSECNANGGLLCEYSGGCVVSDALPLMLDGSVESSLAEHGPRSSTVSSPGDTSPYIRDCRGIIRGRQYSPEVVAAHRSATAALVL